MESIKPEKVRVRIAPSPTGFLHIGSARTALFNYLFAKKYQGDFILRIEDTDLKRSSLEFEKDILENLKWLGLKWDEGPDISGQYSPYRQSERLDIYAKYIEKLLKENKAYYCFCSEKELGDERQYQMSMGESLRYSGKCATLNQERAKKYLNEGKPSVIRFRSLSTKISFNDLIRGRLEFDTSLLGDIVIAKNLSTPLYNFVVVIDDFEMKITHVIRGEEHISNTPKQILIQEALNFPQPRYAHLPLILAPDRTKLSKRQGTTSVAEYRKTGYLPEALINFIVFLGWNPGTEQEIFSLSTLIKEFSLEKIQKGGAIFNITRLDYLNGFYIRQKSVEKLTEICLPYLIKAGFIIPQFKKIESCPSRKAIGGVKTFYLMPLLKRIVSFDYLKLIIGLEQKRMKKISEICSLVDFFFTNELKYNKELLKWKEMTDKELFQVLKKLEEILLKIKTKQFNQENLEKILLPESIKFVERVNKTKDRGYFLWPLRVALTGKQTSAGPFEIAKILGKERTIMRIKNAQKILKT